VTLSPPPPLRVGPLKPDRSQGRAIRLGDGGGGVRLQVDSAGKVSLRYRSRLYKSASAGPTRAARSSSWSPTRASAWSTSRGNWSASWPWIPAATTSGSHTT